MVRQARSAPVAVGHRADLGRPSIRRGGSSDGRAPALQAGGHGFDSRPLHTMTLPDAGAIRGLFVSPHPFPPPRGRAGCRRPPPATGRAKAWAASESNVPGTTRFPGRGRRTSSMAPTNPAPERTGGEPQAAPGPRLRRLRRWPSHRVALAAVALSAFLTSALLTWRLAPPGGLPAVQGRPGGWWPGTEKGAPHPGDIEDGSVEAGAGHRSPAPEQPA